MIQNIQYSASWRNVFCGYTDATEYYNKHKFVQKVAKKIILLISFKFNASSVHKWGLQDLMRLNGIKWGQIWPNWTKQDQTGLNICQTELNRVK